MLPKLELVSISRNFITLTNAFRPSMMPWCVGAHYLSGMLILCIVMAIEKNMPWGRRIAHPLGAALTVAALVLIAT